MATDAWQPLCAFRFRSEDKMVCLYLSEIQHKSYICPFSAKFARILIIRILLYGPHKFTAVLSENNSLSHVSITKQSALLPSSALFHLGFLCVYVSECELVLL